MPTDGEESMLQKLMKMATGRWEGGYGSGLVRVRRGKSYSLVLFYWNNEVAVIHTHTHIYLYMFIYVKVKYQKCP